MNSPSLTLAMLLAFAIFALASAGCTNHAKTQRSPDLVAQPATPAPPPQPDWLSRTADGVSDVVTAPARLLSSKPKVTKKLEPYEPAEAIIISRTPEEPPEAPTSQPASQPR